MANKYVDYDDGSNANTGNWGYPWKTIEYALESGSLSAGDKVWVRRRRSGKTANEIPASNIVVAYAGTISSPISIIGMPRPERNLTTATWTPSSALVTNAAVESDGENTSINDYKHLGRRITINSSSGDGSSYIITKIVSTSSFYIDRPYTGPTTVSGSSGSAVIEADEDTRPSEASSWDSDYDSTHTLNFYWNSYYLNTNQKAGLIFKNLRFQNSSNSTGMIYLTNPSSWAYPSEYAFINCVFAQTSNAPVICARITNVYAQPIWLTLRNVVIWGSGTSQSAQTAVLAKDSVVTGAFDAGIDLRMIDSCIYNMGYKGLDLVNSRAYLENVNVGYVNEGRNSSVDLSVAGGIISGRDVLIDDSAPSIWYSRSPFSGAFIENYHKTLGDHRNYNGAYITTSEDAGGSNPSQRSGGNDVLMKVVCNTNISNSLNENWAAELFSHEYEALASTTKTWRYYFQKDSSMPTLSSSDLWIELEYISHYASSTRYVISKVKSDESISTNNSWVYLEVPNITPAVTGKLRIKCFATFYDSDGTLWIDPKVTVT